MEKTIIVKQASSGAPLLLLATVLLGVLKTAGLIAISWWWVFSPLWIPVAVFLAVIAVGLVGFLLVMAFAELKRGYRLRSNMRRQQKTKVA